jgi:hypothetical protein
MKKVLSLILVLVMVCSFAACGEEADTAKLQAYIDASGQELVDGMEQAFAGASGMTCKSSIKAEDSGIVITLKIDDLDGLTQEQKDLMQAQYDSMQSTFDNLLDELQKDVPEAKHFTIKVCEKDGDLIAKIVAKD